MEIEIIEPGYYYHIYIRGINRKPIFIEEEHYLKFLTLCKKYLSDTSDVLAYCLLPNHFHMLVYIKDHPDRVLELCQGNSSLSLSHLFNSYAQWLNKKTGRTGGLFQRPFKRIRITDEEYLKKLIYYIHRNPLHHRQCEKPEDYRFSSYRSIFSNQNTLFKRHQVLEWFGGRTNFIDYHKMQFEIDNLVFFDDE
jgi:putative transposase